jgi:para-aminobenzoate synthetase / 4-amino-4-deoxychorismate lyase
MDEVEDCRVVLRDASTGNWLEFRRPVAFLSAATESDVLPLLARIEAEVDGGALHAAGWVSYEAAPAFDPALVVGPSGDFPLVWFGLFRDCLPFSPPSDLPPSAPQISWIPSITEDVYLRSLRSIRERIRQGDTYQVNFSFRLQAVPPVDPWSLFLHMIRAQGAGYGGFLHTGRWTICSASPELFFRRDGEQLQSRPMKGTAPRGRTTAEDRQLSAELKGSVKNRAENLMIVDMVRNDMGRVGKPGTVLPGPLFDVEQYPTLWQMTSTVNCRTQASLPEVFSALFPAASITGAPKVRTMEIIRDLESTPRRIYTGSIGFVSPGRKAQFNVAIRTVLIDAMRSTAEYGTGSGIVWDSEEHSEFAECLLKAEIVARPRPVFDLLETLRWSPQEGYTLLERHLDRLLDSAAYFGWPCNREEIVRVLEECSSGAEGRAVMVRLTLASTGKALAKRLPLPAATTYSVGLAKEPVSPADVFLYHKTTHRVVYERALQQVQGYDDVLLWNATGEITESTRANVVVDLDGVLLTPPLVCGLLPGVHRAELLARGTLREGVIRREDLHRASRVYLLNAVRGMWAVEYDPGA